MMTNAKRSGRAKERSIKLMARLVDIEKRLSKLEKPKKAKKEENNE